MNRRSHLFRQPTRWYDHDFGEQNHLPVSLQSWLNETGSLTQRLRKQHNNQFRVEVLLQNWAHGFADETAILQQPQQRYQLIREVILYASHQPVILARTVIPPETLAFANRKLSRLGTRPLGEVIFAYPDLKIQQRQFSVTQINLPTIDPKTQLGSNKIWGRRSLYDISGHPLLVAEFFLPFCYQED